MNDSYSKHVEATEIASYKENVWIAYYYSNETLSGKPVATKEIPASGKWSEFSENNGMGSPVPGVVPNNYFSAKYVLSKKLTAGDYIIRTGADDGVRVYIDGELVLDKWNPTEYKQQGTRVRIEDREDAPAGEKTLHLIEVEYFERRGASSIDFKIQPFEEAVNQDGWLGEFYTNDILSGYPTLVVGGNGSESTIDKIKLDWKFGSPSPEIPSNYFSARFTKDFQIDVAGEYNFQAIADDGVRVYIDNELVIDSWVPSAKGVRSETLYLSEGKHRIVVEYFERRGSASLNVTMSPVPIIKQPYVHENWGYGAPLPNLPVNDFKVIFDQSQHLNAGDYFIQTFADDSVQMYVNGNKIIDSVTDKSTDFINRALLTNVQQGNYDIKTHFTENSGVASLYSDIVPFDTWIAYYYPNQTLSGQPVAAKRIPSKGNWSEFSEDNGRGSPVPGKVPNDNFSARYATAKRLPAGEYIIRAGADDGVRVYVDGELVLDRWHPAEFKEHGTKIQLSDRTDVSAEEKDVHFIEVEYFERRGASKVHFKIQPFEDAINTTSWVGEFYTNDSLSGQPEMVVGGTAAQNSIDKVKLDWKFGSPSPEIPADYFSIRFTKDAEINYTGDYTIRAKADDGVRVYVDGELVIDSWVPSDEAVRENTIHLEKGIHRVVIEYFERRGSASLNVELSPNFAFYKQPRVHFHWGYGSPNPNISNDNFKAVFDQSQYLSAGDYFVKTFADDHVQVYFNDEKIIDSTDDKSDTRIDTAILTNLTDGHYNIHTYFEEVRGVAQVYSDIVPFDTWLVYYYPNTTLSGHPIGADRFASKGNWSLLQQNHGTGSPLPNYVPNDNYSAHYVTAKRIPAGDYIVRVKADEGVKVLIDGQVVIDDWNNSSNEEITKLIQIADNPNANEQDKNIHWLEIEYYDKSGESNVSFMLQPYEEAIGENDWLIEYFPNNNLSGTPIIIGGNNLEQTRGSNTFNYNWGTGSPHPNIPKDNFSARFSKDITVNSNGNYKFVLTADDGVRVYVDGNIVIDSWEPSANGKREANVNLTAGKHRVVIEYFERSGAAAISFTFGTKLVEYLYTNYGYTLDDMVNIQARTNPVTDSYGPYGYVHKDYIVYKDNKYVVNVGTTLNVRQSPNGRIVGSLKNGKTVSVVSTEGDWYKIWYSWKLATRDDIKKYVNPNTYSPESVEFFQFLKLSEPAGLDVTEVNNTILKGKGILAGKAEAFIQAGETHHINELYLISHALLETGNGTSELAKGVKYNGVTVYNMYGIGAYDGCAVSCGAQYAYERGWTTPEKAIIGGAQFVSKNYIHAGQDTLYKMRWNPANPGTHQYATDIGWAVKQAPNIKKLYDSLSSYRMVFDIPKFK